MIQVTPLILEDNLASVHSPQ